MPESARTRDPAPSGTGTPPARGRAGVLRRLLRHRSGRIGLILTLIFLFLAVAGPWLAPYDPAEPDYSQLTVSFTAEHWLGTDAFGRDTLSRILAGARYSISIGVAATVLGALVGGLWGLWAGFAGGAVEAVSMRLVDVLLAFPGLLIAIGLITITGPGVGPVTFAASLFGVPVFARLTRGTTLAIKQRVYIEAAQGLGANGARIMFRHVLPATITPVLVYATLRSGVTLLVASGLSFLGLGVQPPDPSETGTSKPRTRSWPSTNANPRPDVGHLLRRGGRGSS